MSVEVDEFMTESELVALSGYVQRAAIRRWLEQHGVRYLRARDGTPRVRRDEIRPTAGTVTINMDALRGTRRKTA